MDSLWSTLSLWQWHQPLWLWLIFLPFVWAGLRAFLQRRQQVQFADPALWPWIRAESVKADQPGSSHFGKLVGALTSSLTSPKLWLTLAWVAWMIALAEPRTWTAQTELSERQGADILIVMDVSRSMLAEDENPNRFLFAKALANSLNDALQADDRIGLMAFQAYPHLVSPLSYDRSLLTHYLQLIHPDIMPLRGSSIQLALVKAHHYLQQVGQQNGVVILFTNGAPDPWQLQPEPKGFKALSNKSNGAHTIIVGIGENRPVPIPEAETAGGLKKPLKVNGLRVQSRLEEAFLRKLAQQVGGDYLHADASQAFIQSLLDRIAQVAGRRQVSQENGQWESKAQPFIIAGFLFLMLSFYPLGLLGRGAKQKDSIQRSQKANLLKPTQQQGSFQPFSSAGLGILAMSAVLLFILSGKTWAQDEKRPDLTQKSSKLNENLSKIAKIPSPAYDGDAPEAVRLPLASFKKATLAWQAYQNHDYELATEYFDEVGGYLGWFNAGDAAYRNKDYESAVFYFRQALLSAGDDWQRAQALYNLGNTYYQSNLLPLAIEAYQGALLYQPDYAKAKHNLAVAQWRLNQERRGKKKKGAGGGKSSKDNEGAFYGGQKPSEQNEPGKGGDGDAPEGDKNGKEFQLPPAEDEQQYDLTAQPTFILTEEGNAILSQQAQARKIERLEQSLQQVEDKQSELLQRLFEREEGFEAHQTEKHQLPGVQPW